MDTSLAVGALAALAHEHRLGVYRLLVEAGPEGLNASSVALQLDIPASSLTFHLQHLQRAGLIAQARDGRQLIYTADYSVMNSLVAYLTENCCGGGSSACAPSCAPVSGGSRKTAKRLVTSE